MTIFQKYYISNNLILSGDMINFIVYVQLNNYNTGLALPACLLNSILSEQ